MRILHISDIHLFCPQALSLHKVINKRLLGLINWYLKRRRTVSYRLLDLLVASVSVLSPDVICVTGDLVHLAQKREFELASQWLSELESFSPIKLVPGNHDLYVPEAKSYLQKYFKRFFSISHTIAMPNKALDDFFPYVDILENIALIGLSSAYTCSLSLATGRIGQKQLKNLSYVLENTKDKGLLRIILIHHPPISGLVKKRKALLDVNHLKNVTDSKGTELFLFGHTHKRFCHLREKPKDRTLFLCAPSVTSIKPGVMERAGFYLIDIKNTGSLQKADVSDFILADNEESFVRQKRFDVFFRS